jgi:hypothetical protein
VPPPVGSQTEGQDTSHQFSLNDCLPIIHPRVGLLKSYRLESATISVDVSLVPSMFLIFPDRSTSDDEGLSLTIPEIFGGDVAGKWLFSFFKKSLSIFIPTPECIVVEYVSFFGNGFFCDAIMLDN